MSNLLNKATLLTAILFSGSGCSWMMGDDGFFRDRSNDYRQASVEPPLQLPAGIDSDAIDDSYAIPAISDRSTLSDEYVMPRPEPLATDLGRESVRINTFGDQRWILVDGSPGEVWPRLRGFLSLNQFSVQRADAVSGIIETGWLQPAGENTLRERYRLRVDQGVQRGTSEIYVLQADIRAGEHDWPESSSNAERDNLMTRELAQYLADSVAAAVSMLAQQAIDSSGKVSLEQGTNALPYLKLVLPFDRAWASVGKALDKAGYTIDDLDRSQQLYYLHYRQLSEEENDKERGFLSSLFSWGKSETADKDSDPGTAYFLRVKQQDENAVAISIERQSGENMEKTEAEKLLKLIKRHLS